MAEWKGKFGEITAMTHTEQGIWWLNGFWEDGAKDYAEDMWRIVHAFIELDVGFPILYGGRMREYKEKSDLDEMASHQILEKLGETMTVMALRKRLKELDLDNNKRMAISEYLLDKYKKTPQVLVKAPQGDVDPAELAAAQSACENAANLLDQASSDAEAASKALAASEKAAEEAAATKAAAEEALAASEKAEATVKAAEAELQAAVDEIANLEKTKADKIAKCQAVIDDDSASGVKKGRAVQEKAALDSEDELPLRKAKITQGAALKRVKKARVAAEAETAKAEAAAKAAAAAKEAADAAAAAAATAKETADKAKAAAEEALAEAQKQLDDLKSKGGGSPQGKIWWMERTLAEKKKFTK